MFGIGGWLILMNNVKMEGFTIRKRHEHYEVYMYDEFFCSADTYEEALKEIEEYWEDGNRD